MKYTTKKIELTDDHFLAVTDLAEYTHEIFSDFKNSHFGHVHTFFCVGYLSCSITLRIIGISYISFKWTGK